MTIETFGIATSQEDLDRIVEEQMREVKVAGQVYRFRPESHCRVCRNPDLRERIEDLLAVGTTYREILTIIAPRNVPRARRDQITYHSIRVHVEDDHFPINKAAQQVYRKILERRAIQFDQNFVKGVGHAVTLMAVLETVMVKGYAGIVDERVPITPELAISAGIKLHELTARDQSATQAAEMIAQVHRLTEVVNRVCSPEQLREIETALSGDAGALDVDYTEEDDDDDEDFDPARDAEEPTTTDDQGF